jgi:large subunit ribosomal protein L29
MKGLKYAQLADHSEAQLQKQIGENQARITALRFQKTVGQLDNHAQILTLRRDIARMQTALSTRKESK